KARGNERTRNANTHHVNPHECHTARHATTQANETTRKGNNPHEKRKGIPRKLESNRGMSTTHTHHDNDTTNSTQSTRRNGKEHSTKVTRNAREKIEAKGKAKDDRYVYTAENQIRN